MLGSSQRPHSAPPLCPPLSGSAPLRRHDGKVIPGGNETGSIQSLFSFIILRTLSSSPLMLWSQQLLPPSPPPGCAPNSCPAMEPLRLRHAHRHLGTDPGRLVEQAEVVGVRGGPSSWYCLNEMRVSLLPTPNNTPPEPAPSPLRMVWRTSSCCTHSMMSTSPLPPQDGVEDVLMLRSLKDVNLPKFRGPASGEGGRRRGSTLPHTSSQG